MSIEIGSKWVKDGEVVEVTNFYESVSIWCIWFIDSKTISHILTERDFLEQYKPYDVVYEFQYAYRYYNDAWCTTGYLINKEFEELKNNSNDKYEFKRLDFTKRERKQ